MNSPDPSETFLLEAEDLLNQVEETLLEIEERPDDAEAVHRLFRAFHTLKGSGAMFGFSAISDFAHHVETVLDRLRDRTLAISTELVGLVLAARDHLKALLERGKGRHPQLEAKSAELTRKLQALLPDSASALRPVPPSECTTAAAADASGGGSEERGFRIHFRPAPDIATTGLDPASLLAELRTLGACDVAANLGAVPPLEALDPERCYLGWEVLLATCHDLNRVRDVFVFVEDTSELRIEPCSIPVVAPQAREVSTPPPESPDRALAPSSSGAGKSSVVRVPSQKLDHLVSLVGELVINQSRLLQVAAKIDSADLHAPVEALERLVAEMRDSVLGIRMMPIGSTFARFKRLVHDLAPELGKDVELVTEGAETELDKTVLDQIAEPLVHLIRNSIDHGIETPDARVAAGKQRAGVVRLAASHQGSHVVIAIEDDGRGIDADAVRRKAIEKRLIDPAASLSEKDVFALILLPGLSTAKSVTSVSGRGVGMDVVKRQIEALRGTIEISSAIGRGTSIRLTLPLTLAIIEGLLIEVNSDQFVLPMSVVLENVEIDTVREGKLCGQNAVAVRGELVPFLCLRELFRISGERPAHEKVVIVSHNGQRVGLSVDRVLGKHQTVIQSLGRFYQHVEVASGATIMGDGRVALILDVAGLLRAASAERESLLRHRAPSLSSAAAVRRGTELP
ncbi:chemotaxis protein CheA [Opitutaceae bacterium EW11]|nr:chemotaxis protein CheA [Opitutaceae bacterium EW11]